MKSIVLAGMAVLLGGCGTRYVYNDTKADFKFEGANWVSEATTDLENRGHTYRASADKTWKAVHLVLKEMGVSVKDEDREWRVIHDTYPAETPSGEVQAFIRDINSRFDTFKAVRARYRLTISCNTVTPERTNVICRVYWDVLKKGERQWTPFNPNRRVIEHFYRRLDKRLPAFRDNTQHMWQGW
ncbi:MAG TPA: hypothetical protein ENN09_04300 [Planctomycetes bacterium]|nr:hypothetical protein [Planctomycetota bacterium]